MASDDMLCRLFRCRDDEPLLWVCEAGEEMTEEGCELGGGIEASYVVPCLSSCFRAQTE